MSGQIWFTKGPAVFEKFLIRFRFFGHIVELVHAVKCSSNQLISCLIFMCLDKYLFSLQQKNRQAYPETLWVSRALK